MHPLLARQLKRLVGEQMLDPAAIPSPWKELVAAVDSAYIAGDADRALIERSMEIASEELFQRNRELVVNNAALEAAKIEQRKAHDELEFRVAQRTAQLRAAMEQAEAANQSKSAFLANMSHEIRTPMSAILGYADMLLAEDRSRQQQIDCIQTIRRQGEHLLAILNDILDLSKIEAGKLLVETVNCDPCRIVADALSLMRVRALEKQLTCEALYVGQIPKSIRTDPTRLRQILINLLGNAIKFTKSGEVRLIVSFDVEAPKTAPRIKFEIQDSGIGMTAEQAAGLFKPFVQVDASNTRKFGGTGLGLSICKRLSQILGGDISVSSRPGSGSKFTVTVATGDLSGIEFICPSSEAMKHDAFAAENIHADPAPHLRGRVLIAEDGLFNQEVFRFYLEEAGLEVDMVENGKLACDRFAQACANDKPFDLVIMDMQMPELDGYDATTRLRAAGVNAPIIAVTANAMSGDRERCIAVGCNDYLTKPIDRAVMLSTLKNYLPKAA